MLLTNWLITSLALISFQNTYIIFELRDGEEKSLLTLKNNIL